MSWQSAPHADKRDPQTSLYSKDLEHPVLQKSQITRQRCITRTLLAETLILRAKAMPMLRIYIGFSNASMIGHVLRYISGS